MRAHYKRSKHLVGVAWFRLWLSPVFEQATCAQPPNGEPLDTWSRQWTSPETPSETRIALDLCNQQCPVLMECRALVEMGEVPRGVVQAGRAFGLRIGPAPKRVPSLATPATTDEEAC